MKDLHTDEQIKEMRKRLYQRGAAAEHNERHQLSDTKIEVSRDWSGGVEARRPATTDLRSGTSLTVTDEIANQEEIPPQSGNKNRRYRTFVLGGSFIIFIVLAMISGWMIFSGENQISGDNIQISIEGQPLVGGGEVMPLQVSVTNSNSVPIEAATLILKYPVGTRSVGDNPDNLYEDRIAINDIASGETYNIPIKVAIFGEENAEKSIEATIEYRINGSNSVFHKDADSFDLRISSSPLVLQIDSVEKVASGQLVDVALTVVSNASSPLEDIVIKASYPNGFAFETANPEPQYGDDVWYIDELQPEERKEIKIQGVVTGLTEESLRIKFSAGPTDPDNQYLVGATLAEGHIDFLIERPFIDVGIVVAGDRDGEAVISQGKVAKVDVMITNTLDETVYDMTVEVVPGGNALDEDSIESSGGFYDSNTGTVRWEVANNSTFREVLPGDSRQLDFTVTPSSNKTTASFDLVVNVYARRVAESNALETLVGTVRAEAKYSATVMLGSQVGKNVGRFGDSGPIPPKVGEDSTYTVTLVAEAGANDMTNAVVNSSLPLYVNWLDQYDAPGEVEYNSVSKEIQWDIGDISSGQRKEFVFQVSLKPSVSQVGSSPVLVNVQNIKANDRFTGALLQDKSRAVTTELSTEMGYPPKNGRVE